MECLGKYRTHEGMDWECFNLFQVCTHIYLGIGNEKMFIAHLYIYLRRSNTKRTKYNLDNWLQLVLIYVGRKEQLVQFYNVLYYGF